MLFWFVLGFVVLGLFLLFGRWYATAPTAHAKRAAKILLGIGIGLVALILLTRGGLSPVISGLIALAPVLFSLRGAFRRARAAQGPSPGGASNVSSAWFEMTLDHETGDITGQVVQGDFAGRDLDDLDEADLNAIARDCAGDPNSARLLQAYMARRFGYADPEEDGFAGEQERPSSATGGMSRAEALSILGLDEAAERDDINAAYKRLIAKAHPDAGGSAYLAAKINEARQVLLGA